MIQTLVRKIVVYEDKVEIFYNYTDETNPGDGTPRDSYLLSGSDSSVMVDSAQTNPNPTFRFSEKWFCAVVNLSDSS